MPGLKFSNVITIGITFESSVLNHSQLVLNEIRDVLMIGSASISVTDMHF